MKKIKIDKVNTIKKLKYNTIEREYIKTTLTTI